MRRKHWGAFLLATGLLLLAAGSALANLSKGDPNDFRYKPDIKRSATVKYRGDYQGTETLLIRATLNFHDGIAWEKVNVIQVAFDTKGADKADYSINWIKGDAVGGGFGCWLQEGAGLFPGGIIRDETEVAAQGRSATSVTCTVPRLAMRVTKPIQWKVMVWAGPGDAPFDETFDFAPNRRWYPHL